ncbi:MAG: ATP-dependent helicase [Fibrobacter sp.]|nr:ATP-dependent helicase [Fibrobacter sp.]
MNSLLSGLNDEQKRAVTISRNHHTLVLAGAGCGKTTVLTRRIAYLVTNGISQEKILALTFTRKAAQEMLERVKMLPQIDPEKPMAQITTFHGFALKLLAAKIDGKSNFERIGFKHSPVLMEHQKRMEILSQITDKNTRAALNSDLIKLDSLLSQFVVFPKRLVSLSSEQKAILQNVVDKYNLAKQHQGLWDFSDLLSCAFKLCKDNPDIVKRTTGTFDAVLVDEFQDTNPLQISFLNCFIDTRCTLFAVGDDDQAIYGFRGADIDPTINFKSYFEGAVIVKLQTNYRSKPLILDMANRIFSDKPDIYKKVLVSGRYGKSDRGVMPQKCMFSSQDDMASWIMRTAEQIATKTGIDILDMAALFRVNQTCNFMESLVEKFPKSARPQFLTVHRSKGLEYPVVFLCDLEEGVFPNYRISSGKKHVNSFVDLVKTWYSKSGPECDFEEEKRLFYVGVTRAMEYLYLLSCSRKMLYGRLHRFDRSRFLRLV